MPNPYATLSINDGTLQREHAAALKRAREDRLEIMELRKRIEDMREAEVERTRDLSSCLAGIFAEARDRRTDPLREVVLGWLTRLGELLPPVDLAEEDPTELEAREKGAA